MNGPGAATALLRRREEWGGRGLKRGFWAPRRRWRLAGGCDAFVVSSANPSPPSLTPTLKHSDTRHANLEALEPFWLLLFGGCLSGDHQSLFRGSFP